MRTDDVCTKEVVFVDRETTVRQAAQTMRERHVGDVVIVDSKVNPRKPVGILTDRDIVLSVVAPAIDPSIFTVGDVMGARLLTVRSAEDAFETVRQMRVRGVRRAPVVDDHGELCGVFSVDDFLGVMAQQRGEVANLISREQAREVATRV